MDSRLRYRHTDAIILKIHCPFVAKHEVRSVVTIEFDFGFSVGSRGLRVRSQSVCGHYSHTHAASTMTIGQPSDAEPFECDIAKMCANGEVIDVETLCFCLIAAMMRSDFNVYL